MTENARGLSTAIRVHLQGLLGSSGLPDTEESLEEMIRVWFEKKDMFESQVKALDMQQLERFSAEDPRGALVLTWSGSLLSMGPATGAGAGRRMEYASIELRTDVPHLAVSEGGELESDLAVGELAKLRSGPISSTSALLTIAACDAAVPAEEQEKRIREATIFLTNGFVRINRTVTRPGRDFPEQLTMKSIVTYLARKNELSQKKTRQLLDDYLAMLESGLLLGLRVPLGKMGRLSLRKKPARKARVGINPATGGTITLKARPEEQAPRMAFSRLLKDRVRQTSVQGPTRNP
jgi:nucleoid DNA-binding protein